MVHEIRHPKQHSRPFITKQTLHETAKVGLSDIVFVSVFHFLFLSVGTGWMAQVYEIFSKDLKSIFVWLRLLVKGKGLTLVKTFRFSKLLAETGEISEILDW